MEFWCSFILVWVIPFNLGIYQVSAFAENLRVQIRFAPQTLRIQIWITIWFSVAMEENIVIKHTHLREHRIVLDGVVFQGAPDYDGGLEVLFSF